MKTIKNLTLGAALLGALIPGRATAEIAGNVEGIASLEQGIDMVRPNVFFDIKELGTSNYTWHEFYEDGSHSGRTAFSKPITSNFGIRSDTEYGTGKNADLSIGAEVSASPREGLFASVYGLVFGEDKTIIGYFFDTNIGPLNVSSFNEWNVAKGLEQSYGELNLSVPVSNGYSAGLNVMALQGENGGTSLDTEVRAIVKRDF